MGTRSRSLEPACRKTSIESRLSRVDHTVYGCANNHTVVPVRLRSEHLRVGKNEHTRCKLRPQSRSGIYIYIYIVFRKAPKSKSIGGVRLGCEAPIPQIRNQIRPTVIVRRSVLSGTPCTLSAHQASSFAKEQIFPRRNGGESPS